MAAKTKAESPSKAAPQGRKREIAGVVMLAFGLFAGLSMLSMQLGAHQMMGPGGAATASGLYALGGMAAYLFVAWLLVMAVRCFRGLSFIDGPLEGLGAVMLLAAASPRRRRSSSRSCSSPTFACRRSPSCWGGRCARAAARSWLA
jgi:hypothetical protein